MRQPILISALAIFAFITGAIISGAASASHYNPQIESLEADKLALNKEIRRIESRHQTNRNSYLVEVGRLNAEIVRLESTEAEAEKRKRFREGVYLSCIVAAFLNNPQPSRSEAVETCNRWTRLIWQDGGYDVEMPGIDHDRIVGKAGLESG